MWNKFEYFHIVPTSFSNRTVVLCEFPTEEHPKDGRRRADGCGRARTAAETPTAIQPTIHRAQEEPAIQVNHNFSINVTAREFYLKLIFRRFAGQ